MLRDFYDLWPEKFLNVTNGVTPRRFLALSNPSLSELITRKIGTGWVRNLEELRRLEEFAEDMEFHRDWRRVKLTNKGTLAAVIKERTGVAVNPASLFDIQVKRLHEYKRQHLNVLHIITLYNRLKRQPEQDITPRTFIFGGKAAPGYFMAKLIIKLINSVAEVVNNDPDVQDRLKVVYFPGFQREERPARLPGRRPLGADLHRRQGGLRHRQHEVRHERRSHHRHPGRRQRGNPGGGGSGKLLPVRAHG